MTNLKNHTFNYILKINRSFVLKYLKSTFEIDNNYPIPPSISEAKSAVKHLFFGILDFQKSSITCQNRKLLPLLICELPCNYN